MTPLTGEESRIGLIAPCGMNCGLCRAYLAQSRGIPKKRGEVIHCIGCRPRGKKCAYLKGHCENLHHDRVTYCFECSDFPCRRLQSLDKRYRTRYHVSLIGNLEAIKRDGIDKFLEDQATRFRCRECGGTVSVHDGKCYDCLGKKLVG